MATQETNPYVPPAGALYTLAAGLLLIALGRALQAVDDNLAHLEN